MTRNPVINALGALSYIVAVVSLLRYVSKVLAGTEESIFIPIAVLSLFVFSAASMGFIFLYQPLRLLVEGEAGESANLFLTMLAVFAVSAAVLVLAGLYLSANLLM